MKTPLKITLIVFAILIVFVSAAIIHIVFFLPNIPVDEYLTIGPTRDMIIRGEYLANHVMVCVDCHGTRDWTKFSGPMIPETEGVGGEEFDESMGLPGTYYAPNITPAAIGDWTPGEIYRAITTGVSRDNRALFPIMPYPYFGQLTDEDIHSVIAYIRQLPARPHAVPKSKNNFPMNIIVNTIPHISKKLEKPSSYDSVAYGKYMATASGCMECHTQVEQGQIIPERAFSGGREFPMPGFGMVRTANLTPDMDTGIGRWNKKRFVDQFKFYDLSNYNPPRVGKNEFNTMMPWTMYAGMTREDLGAIYDYLHSLEPIRNEVVKFTPESQLQE